MQLTCIGMYAHTAERDWESNIDILGSKCDDESIDDIAEQLIHGKVGKQLKVIFGGGRSNFLDKSQNDEQGVPGRRSDGKDLVTEWLNNKQKTEQRTFIWNKVCFALFVFLSLFAILL